MTLNPAPLTFIRVLKSDGISPAFLVIRDVKDDVRITLVFSLPIDTRN